MPVWEDIELPGFDATLVEVAAARKQALVAHLRSVLANLRNPGPEPGAGAQPASSWLAEACATCRGYCCREGRDGRFLDAESMALAWCKAAHLSRDELIARYVQAVPEQSFSGSCIFHSATGCSLPRSMRPRICTDYLCRNLRLAAASPNSPTADATDHARR